MSLWLAVCLLLGTALCQNAHAATIAWYNNSWQYRRQITIDKSMVPNTDQSNFPVLIYKASDNDLKGKAQSDGDDILFTSSNGTTKLNHEIEKYTSGTGALVAWVMIPTLTTATNTVIYMYYGNAAAANQESITATWNENGNNNFKAVFHLKEDLAGIGNSALYQDSTTNNNDLDDNISSTVKTGQIYNGQDFDGTDDYASMAAHSASATIITDVTIEAWVNQDTTSGDHTIVNFSAAGELETQNYAYSMALTTANKLVLEWEHGAGVNDVVTSSATVTTATGTWVHYSATRDVTANEVKFYENGVQLGTTQSYTNDPTGASVSILVLGYKRSSATLYMDGKIDEVHISNILRTADWLKTSYNNQNSPATYETFGAEEPQMHAVFFGINF